MYSVKAITTLTGLTPETLRAWERRYAGITPARSENGRRLYSPQELEKLTLLADLTRNGHSIGKIATLDCDALRELQQAQNRQQDAGPPLLEQIVEALLDYRIDRCEHLLKRAMLAYEPMHYASEVLMPALGKVGDLWHQEKLNVAQEHMFSSCIKRIVLSMTHNLHSTSAGGPAMLFATPSAERHEFGILLSCLLAASLRYRCYYLGADLPGSDIVEAIRHLRPNIIVLGVLQTPPDSLTLEQLRIIAAAEETAESSVWIGGNGAEYWRRHSELPFPNCELITDIRQFYSKAEQWRLWDRG
ncbi:MAG: MerR family transcriptional regulator [Methylobacter sp.]